MLENWKRKVKFDKDLIPLPAKPLSEQGSNKSERLVTPGLGAGTHSHVCLLSSDTEVTLQDLFFVERGCAGGCGCASRQPYRDACVFARAPWCPSQGVGPFLTLCPGLKGARCSHAKAKLKALPKPKMCWQYSVCTDAGSSTRCPQSLARSCFKRVSVSSKVLSYVCVDLYVAHSTCVSECAQRGHVFPQMTMTSLVLSGEALPPLPCYTSLPESVSHCSRSHFQMAGRPARCLNYPVLSQIMHPPRCSLLGRLPFLYVSILFSLNLWQALKYWYFD